MVRLLDLPLPGMQLALEEAHQDLHALRISDAGPGFKIYRSGMAELGGACSRPESWGETCMEKQDQFDDQGLQIPSDLVNDSCVLSLFRFIEQGRIAIHGLLINCWQWLLSVLY